MRQLLAKPGVSTAFARLETSGKLELTVEYLVFRPESLEERRLMPEQRRLNDAQVGHWVRD